MGMKFINLPNTRQFKIVTRFYDPQKEAMKEREDRFKRELEQNDPERPVYSYSAGIKGKFRTAGKLSKGKTFAEARRKSNMRLLYIVILLSGLLYFILK